MHPLVPAARLAGFFAAHAVWSVSDLAGEPLVPMYATENARGERELSRLFAESLEEGVTLGLGQLEENTGPAAVLIYDGRITLPAGKLDALFVKLRGPKGGAMLMAVPYRPAPFAVHKPKLLEVPPEVGDDDIQALLDAFWEGVDGHEEGATVWDAHADPSV